ncbi:MAG: J domain-containing protein [Nanoarchaeota archaeon]
MPTIRIKGHDINYQPVSDSSHRRATQFTNKIIEALGKIGIGVDDVEIEDEPSPMRKAVATVRWFNNGTHCLYTYSRAHKYVDNLQIALKVIETETQNVLKGIKSIEQFIEDFREDDDVVEKRKAAREALGFEHDHHDLNSINVAFKKKSRELHPDMPGGDTEKFKQLNEAHKTLKRELE